MVATLSDLSHKKEICTEKGFGVSCEATAQLEVENDFPKTSSSMKYDMEKLDRRINVLILYVLINKE